MISLSRFLSRLYATIRNIRFTSSPFVLLYPIKKKKKKKKKNLPFETLSREHERELKFKTNLPSAFPPFHLLKKRKNNESILIIRCKDSPFPQKKGEAERKERSEEFSTGAQSLR